MKLYIVNETNLYHECQKEELDSLFSYNNGLYWCKTCLKKSNSLAFFAFNHEKDTNQFHIFTKLPYIINAKYRNRYRLIEVI